jgi:hypothetical protein
MEFADGSTVWCTSGRYAVVTLTCNATATGSAYFEAEPGMSLTNVCANGYLFRFSVPEVSCNAACSCLFFIRVAFLQACDVRNLVVPGTCPTPSLSALPTPSVAPAVPWPAVLTPLFGQCFASQQLTIMPDSGFLYNFNGFGANVGSQV